MPWIETVSHLLEVYNSPDRAIHAFRTSRDTGNTDAFVTAYRACRGV